MTRYLESIWLKYSPILQLIQNIRVKLTLNVESIGLKYSPILQLIQNIWVKLTLNIESIGLKYSPLLQLIQNIRVKLTLNVESIGLKYSPILQLIQNIWVTLTLHIESIGLKYSTITRNLAGRILVLQVTQIFRSKWLNFFSVERWWVREQRQLQFNLSLPETFFRSNFEIKPKTGPYRLPTHRCGAPRIFFFMILPFFKNEILIQQ